MEHGACVAHTIRQCCHSVHHPAMANKSCAVLVTVLNIGKCDAHHGCLLYNLLYHFLSDLYASYGSYGLRWRCLHMADIFNAQELCLGQVQDLPRGHACPKTSRSAYPPSTTHNPGCAAEAVRHQHVASNMPDGLPGASSTTTERLMIRVQTTSEACRCGKCCGST